MNVMNISRPISPSPTLMELLVKQLAIPLSNQKTVAKWLVIANRLSPQAGKSLVIPRRERVRTTAPRVLR